MLLLLLLFLGGAFVAIVTKFVFAIICSHCLCIVLFGVDVIAELLSWLLIVFDFHIINVDFLYCYF